ncbi:MAG: hypothetical protein VKI83_04920 [Synechococcaceae cyanobacterium]|nr:hypothetical protein [Synechococcaceae cyanobacterium]
MTSRSLVWAAAAAAGLVLSGWVVPPPAPAQQSRPIRMSPLQQQGAAVEGVGSAAQPSRTVLQKIRALLGLNRPILAGGSRSSAELDVCVISPPIDATPTNGARGANGSGESAGAVATVPLPRPLLLVQGPVSEMRLQRGEELLWRQRSASISPIEGPISWPLAPLKPGERLRWLIRPTGAAGGDFAAVTLVGASAQEMQRGEALVEQVARDGDAWVQAIERELERGNASMAMALLFYPQDQAEAQLDPLRREVLQNSCR